MLLHDGDARAWAALAPDVPAHWFVRPSTLHGVGHTQRVHIHAQRLTGDLGWDGLDTRLVLTAALWHDIGRTDDGETPGHGAAGAARAVELGLDGDFAPADAGIVLFAVLCHSLPDAFAEEEARRWADARQPEEAQQADRARRLAEPDRALRILWLLKDADALDRVRLAAWEAADPAQLRHPETIALLPFAQELYRVCGR